MTAMSPIRREPEWASSDAFRGGMRRLASGVCLITGGNADAPVGLIATAVCSVSIDPPTLLASINHNAAAFATIDASGRFCVNVLGIEHRDIVGHFTTAVHRDKRFRGGAWRLHPNGPPILDTALAAFDCRVVERLRYSTHTIFLARPETVATGDGDPLLHFERQFHDFR
jgi:flavin reductase